jgi:hypothetical protein
MLIFGVFTITMAKKINYKLVKVIIESDFLEVINRNQSEIS